MSETSQKITLTGSLRRMFKQSTTALTIRHIKDVRLLCGISELLATGKCRKIYLYETHDPEIVLYVLSAISTVRNVLSRLHIDIWNTDYKKLINLLSESLNAQSETLEHLTIKCRFPNEYLTQAIQILPNKLKVLDLSENRVLICYFRITSKASMAALVSYIETSELECVRLVNCNIKPETLGYFVNLMFEIESPFSLRTIEGVDLSECKEIPKNVRLCLKEPACVTRKRQMNYKDYSKISRYDTSVQFIDHLRNAIFMKRLVGLIVRVWWPPTEDDNRTAFSGRFWPAKVLMVNPIDLVVVVLYDNDEVDHVPCKFVQPLNPFKYGGGYTDNYSYHLLGSTHPRTNSKSNEFKAHNEMLNFKHKNSYDNSFGETDRESNVDSSDLLKTPESLNTDHYKTNINNIVKRSSISGYSVSSVTTRYEEGFLCRNCGYNNNPDYAINHDVNLDSVEKSLGLDDKFGGNLLVPGEFCEFRDPLDKFRNDPSDYIAVVRKVNKTEPLYECVCIYLDNNEVITLHSNDVRRAVVIPWYNWVSLSFKILTDRRINNDGLTPNRYQLGHPNSGINTLNNTIVNSNNIRECINSNFYYLKRLDLAELDEFCPKNPLEMKLIDMNSYLVPISQEVKSHPKLTSIQKCYINHFIVDVSSGKDEETLKIKSLMEYNETLQRELQAERNKNNELQSKFKCILCFETEINCMLDPCSHFSFCHEYVFLFKNFSRCAKNLKNCPVCRQKISKFKILNLT
uniref:RING-type domain-containing protein n=1 Tax=Theileria annulata TaxID=5874 RepID=A0A3B0MYE6_THEAN